MTSISSHVVAALQLSYTGRHISQRILQFWNVVLSKDIHRLARLIILVIFDMLLGLCMAHLLRSLFVTPQRSIGNKRIITWHTKITYEF